ncbi:AraC family transcriptional regulator [Paenibacillus sp. Marseille-Q4541]|uniref:AraC family transcriptional regulator n=1 Tax=Paenibacillus sp. Marseille-Q4541 TaxID=2831522 RepID=UPI001BACD077|nr:AraC family transcriptional regulator [Paenibacillus sp. Marseille-Q4541]
MRKSKTFYNIFIPILILSIGLVMGLGSYIYFSTIRSVADRVGESHQSLITQIRNTLEQKIQTIEYAFNTYSTTKSFQEIINNPLTERDFEIYRELNTQLNYIATMGLDGVEYSLISLNQNWKISKGSLTRVSEEESNELYEQYIEKASKGLYWIKTDDGIRFVHTLPVSSKDKKAIALSDISLHTLNQTLQTKPDLPVYILNKEGEVLYTAETEKAKLTEQQIQKISEQAMHEPLKGKIKLEGDVGGSVLALFAKSDYNNWTYVTLLDEEEVSEALTTTRVGLIIMGIVIMVLMIVLAYVLSIYLTRPFRKIQSSLSKNPVLIPKDEVDFIISSIDSIVSEKESLQHLIEIEKPKLETQFVLNLLQNRVTQEEAEKSLSQFGYPITHNTVFVTMLIQLDIYGNVQLSDKDVLLFAVNNMVQEIVPESGRMLPVVLNERTQATVLLFEKETDPGMRDKILNYAKTIIKSTREFLKFSVSIGISMSYNDVLNSREACEMSLEALYQRLNLGKESIIFYDDISRGVTGPMLLHYPTELESRLFDAIRLGDEEGVSNSLYPLLADMMKHSKNPMNLEVTLIRFVNNLIQLQQLIGTEVLLTQENANLYHRLLDIRNPEEIERILVYDVIYPMVKSMKEKTNQQFRSIAHKIATIVRTEYDQDLSLELISERLHYSPNYLSSIFRKEYGTTFSEYVMNYRLEVARNWLVDTDMTIKDIAERLRYQNSQNFIRSFRKKEHITPGAYRKMKLEQ